MSTSKSAGRTPAPIMRALGRRSTVTALALVACAACVVGATAARQQAQAGPSFKKVGSWGKQGTGNGQFGTNAYGLATDKAGRRLRRRHRQPSCPGVHGEGRVRAQACRSRRVRRAGRGGRPGRHGLGHAIQAGEAEFRRGGERSGPSGQQAIGVAVDASGNVFVR